MFSRRRCPYPLWALLVGGMMLMPGISQARDKASEIANARQQIRLLTKQISTVEDQLAGTELLIIGGKEAIKAEAAKAKPNEDLLLTLKLTLVALEVNKRNKTKEKTEKETLRDKWEFYLRKLGG
jgi:hypothetical protein